MHPIRRTLVVSAVSAAALAAAVPATAAPEKNLVQTAVAAGQFKTLTSLVQQAGLAGTLSGKGRYTVFAPTDAAFAKVPKSTLKALAKDKAKLRSVLLYHVVKGNVTAARVVKLTSATTLAGPKINIQVRGGSLFLNGSTKVVKTDVLASNGTIHVINKVLLPPTS